MKTFKNIAVLITCYNRKQKTLDCLQQIYHQQLPEGYALTVHITDDASTDGTPEAITKQYPQVELYAGTGSLFWAGGMRYTWSMAMESKPAYYLLLNDDTLLYKTAIATVLKTANSEATPSIVIGSTVDAETGLQSYGGNRLATAGRWKSTMVPATDHAVHCDFGNANILLVPASIVNEIGILSAGYTHGLADYDYTLKAKKAGFNLLMAPGHLGTCKDDHGNNWQSHNVTLKQRIAYLKSPKGLAYHEYLLFIKSHFPGSYPAAFCKLWLKTLFPFLWDAFKNKQVA